MKNILTVKRRLFKIVIFVFLYMIVPVVWGPPAGASPAEERPSLLEILEMELKRAFRDMKPPEGSPMYFLQYEVTEKESARMNACAGALVQDDMTGSRWLDVDVRVGSPKLDNTHQIRGEKSYYSNVSKPVRLCLEDDENAIRTRLWLETEKKLREACEQYTKVLTNRAVKVEEEDTSEDFTICSAEIFIGPSAKIADLSYDRKKWREKLKKYSAIFKKYPQVYNSSVSLSVDCITRYIVNSEGSMIRTSNNYITLTYSCQTRADDGMVLYRNENFDADRFEDLPSDSEIEKSIEKKIGELLALRTAPVVTPYTGPAILKNRACGVFFHEIFGHRVEGHRQKSESEGQTFTKKVGEPVLPEFMDVYDDPTLKKRNGRFLRGYYTHDSEGSRAERVTIVERGILKGFLMTRSPIRNFPRTNGHARRDVSYRSVARQGNLIIEARNAIPYQELRKKLVEECIKQNRPYGLIFEDISGGFTTTGRSGPQTFKVIPLLVYRVYVDGRPDEIVRGVDIVGTPLASFSKITAAASDEDIFNGTCVAESGAVPVSCVAPSVLVSEIEVEKKFKEQERPPLLGAPEQKFFDSQEVVFAAMEDELARSMESLKMDMLERPYFISYAVTEYDFLTVEGFLGKTTSSRPEKRRFISVDVRVGDYSFDNTNFVAGWRSVTPVVRTVPFENDYDSLRRAIWMATDEAYKGALEQLAQKKGYVKTKSITDLPEDFSKEEPVVLMDTAEKPCRSLEEEIPRWDGFVKRISALFLDYPEIQDSNVEFFTGSTKRYYINSEKFRSSRIGELYVLQVKASTQAEDGQCIFDFETFISPDLKTFASFETVEKKVRSMAERIITRKKAPLIHEYIGPVLFTEQAAGEFIRQLFASDLSSPRTPLFASEQLSFMGHKSKLANKINLRIMPEFIDLMDDPGARETEGVALVGGFDVDDEGMKPEKLLIVEKGKLKTIFMSRTPTRKVKNSNGHARAGMYAAPVARPSNLFVLPREKVEENVLRDQLIKLAGEMGLNEALIVRKLRDRDLVLSTDPNTELTDEQREAVLSYPVDAVLVSVETGEERPVRGLEFEAVNQRTLKDIVAAGNRLYVYNFLVGDDPFLPVSIVTPAFLVEEMEMKKSEARPSRLPVIKSPLLEKNKLK